MSAKKYVNKEGDTLIDYSKSPIVAEWLEESGYIEVEVFKKEEAMIIAVIESKGVIKVGLINNYHI